MSDHTHDTHHEEHHVIDYSLYIQVWLSLLFLTTLTVVVAALDFGTVNIVIALLIATVKVGLVVSYFMHVRYDSPVVLGFLGVTGLTLAIIAILFIVDTANR